MVPLKSLPFLVATRNYEPKSLNLKSTYLISIRLRQLSNPLQLLSQFSLSVLQCLVIFSIFIVILNMSNFIIEFAIKY